MKAHVVTGLRWNMMSLYGQNFLDTFAKHWDTNEYKLRVYTDGKRLGIPEERFADEEIPALGAFIEDHKDDLACNGKDPRQWKKKSDVIMHYNFRFDAVKFCRQAFYMSHAATDLVWSGYTGPMIWLDGDVVTYRDVPVDFIDNLLNEDADVSFLGRGGKHPDIGFIAFRLPEAEMMLRSFANMYALKKVFTLPEWHSAYVFKHCVDVSNCRKQDLTEGMGGGHIWFKRPELCRYLDHLKGGRKYIGFSKERKAFE
jgi:hypothetical protein